MSVDWFTVGAQIINFLILVWLLKKFLYKPVSAAMASRQQKVEDELAQAKETAKEAGKEKEHYHALQEETRQQQQELLNQARQEAAELKEKLTTEVKTAAEAAHVRWQQELEEEKTLFLRETSKQVASQFQLMAGQVWRDLADADLEEMIVSRFCVMLASNDEEQLFFQQLTADHELEVFTAFFLSSDSRQTIKMAIGEINKATISFQQETELIAGIKLLTNDHKFEWNIHQYLTEFQAKLDKTLSRKMT